jgi:hypothetical protein
MFQSCLGPDETLISFDKTTWHNILEDGQRPTYHRENLKSHLQEWNLEYKSNPLEPNGNCMYCVLQ